MKMVRPWLAWSLLTFTSAFAADLFWEGTNGTWSVGGGGWKLADGTPTVFAVGDNVTFGTVETESTVVVTMEGQIEAGNILVDAANAYQLGGATRSSASLKQANHFEKRGSGKLFLTQFAGSFTNDWLIAEGEVEYDTTVNLNLAPTNTIFGDVSVPHVIQIGVGDLENRPIVRWNKKGGDQPVNRTNLPAITLIIDAGEVYANAYQNCNVFGRVILRNNAYLRGFNGSTGTYILNDDLIIERNEDDSPATVVPLIEYCYLYFGKAKQEPVCIYVDDITAPTSEDSDDVKDFELKGSVSYDEEAYSWRKRGRGTMLAGNSSYESRNKSDIFVDEGCLIVERGGVGSLRAGKTIYVAEGATLEFIRHDVFTYDSEGYSPLITTVLSNATLRSKGASNAIGNLKIYGSSVVELKNGYSVEGDLKFGRKTEVATDDTFTFRAPTSWNNVLRLSYDLNRLYVTNADNQEHRYGQVEFCIHKAQTHTADFADCVMDVMLCDLSKWLSGPTFSRTDRHTGIVKTGAGVLSVTRNNQYSYITSVEEGGFWVKGSVASNVVVSAGAFVNGTGTVNADVEIAEGGGFMVDATNTMARLNVVGKVNLPRAGLVKLYNVEEPNVMNMAFENIPLPAAASLEGVDQLVPDAWKVEVEGFTPKETKNLHVSFDFAGEIPTYSIGYKQTGTTVVIR